jgi:hypothetical protein
VPAPERLVAWLATYEFLDQKALLPPGLKLQYHSRSDVHSKQLGEFIVEDLLDNCAPLRRQAAAGDVAYGVNVPFRWPNGKAKTLDLAFGILAAPQAPSQGRIRRVSGGNPRRVLAGLEAGPFTRLLLACEEKAVMTEHGKSQPRIYSELNDAHTIVHQGSRDTIAAGITMVNIAATFVSPLRQRADRPVAITSHRQPHVTERMVEHLRHLPIRENRNGVGLDAYCTFVVDADNQGHVSLHTAPPAPQPGDPDHYQTFLERISRLYGERFADLSGLRPAGGLSVEESLIRLAATHPGLLRRAGELIAAEGAAGAEELQALLESLDAVPRRQSGAS